MADTAAAATDSSAEEPAAAEAPTSPGTSTSSTSAGASTANGLSTAAAGVLASSEASSPPAGRRTLAEARSAATAAGEFTAGPRDSQPPAPQAGYTFRFKLSGTFGSGWYRIQPGADGDGAAGGGGATPSGTLVASGLAYPLELADDGSCTYPSGLAFLFAILSDVNKPGLDAPRVRALQVQLARTMLELVGLAQMNVPLAAMAQHDAGALQLGTLLINELVKVAAQDSVAGTVPPRLPLAPQLEPPPFDASTAVDAPTAQRERRQLYEQYTLAGPRSDGGGLCGTNGDTFFAAFVLTNLRAITTIAKRFWDASFVAAPPALGTSEVQAMVDARLALAHAAASGGTPAAGDNQGALEFIAAEYASKGAERQAKLLEQRAQDPKIASGINLDRGHYRAIMTAPETSAALNKTRQDFALAANADEHGAPSEEAKKTGRAQHALDVGVLATLTVPGMAFALTCNTTPQILSVIPAPPPGGAPDAGATKTRDAKNFVWAARCVKSIQDDVHRRYDNLFCNVDVDLRPKSPAFMDWIRLVDPSLFAVIPSPLSPRTAKGMMRRPSGSQ